MKVYELMNQLKGTDATVDQIKSWSYMNRVSPCILDEGLDLDEGVEYPEVLRKTQEKICNECGHDCYKCLDTFFIAEVEA